MPPRHSPDAPASTTLPCAEDFSPNFTSACSDRASFSSSYSITSTVDDATATITACARSYAPATASCARFGAEVGSEPAAGVVSHVTDAHGTTRPAISPLTTTTCAGPERNNLTGNTGDVARTPALAGNVGVHRIDHLAKLIDLFAETQAEAKSETVVRFERRPVAGAPANEGGIDDEKADGTESAACTDGAISTRAKQIEVNIFAIRIAHGQGDQEQLIVQRVVESVAEPGDAGNAELSTPYDEVPLTNHEPGPVEKAAADSIVNPVWEQVEESWWVTPDYQGIADGANLVKSAEDGWRDLLLGKPAEHVALGAGFSPASADVLEAIAAKMSLPGDSTFKDIRRIVQCSGIVLGVVSGAAPLANACVSSLTHDLLAELTAEAFRTAIGHVLAPVDLEIHPIPADELGPDGSRAEQLHGNLVDAAPVQRAHELEIQELEAQRLELERLDVQRLDPWLDGPSL